MGSTAYSKRKGREWENDAADYLTSRGHRFLRRRQTGAKDCGDLVSTDGGPGRLFTIEAKAYADVVTGLRKGTDQSQVERANAGTPFGVNLLKRPRKPVEDAYVVMPLHQFADLLDLLELVDGLEQVA